MTADRSLWLVSGRRKPEQLPPFFEAILSKAVDVSANGFIQVDMVGRTVITVTSSPKATFVVEMYRDGREEVPHDFCKVEARRIGEITGKPLLSFFIDRDRDFGVTDADAKDGWGFADDSDMTEEKRESFLKEFLESQFDLALTGRLFEDVDTFHLLSLSWPFQGI